MRAEFRENGLVLVVLFVGHGKIDWLPVDESDLALVDRRADRAGEGYEHGFDLLWYLRSWLLG